MPHTVIFCVFHECFIIRNYKCRQDVNLTISLGLRNFIPQTIVMLSKCKEVDQVHLKTFQRSTGDDGVISFFSLIVTFRIQVEHFCTNSLTSFCVHYIVLVLIRWWLGSIILNTSNEKLLHDLNSQTAYSSSPLSKEFYFRTRILRVNTLLPFCSILCSLLCECEDSKCGWMPYFSCLPPVYDLVCFLISLAALLCLHANALCSFCQSLPSVSLSS